MLGDSPLGLLGPIVSRRTDLSIVSDFTISRVQFTTG